VVRNVEVRSSNTENKKEADRQTELQGRIEKTIRVLYDREGSGIREDNCGLALDRIKVEINLSRREKCQLLQMSHKCKAHFVKRPGKCKNFVYQFRMQGGLPKSCNSRPIPFSLRSEVRAQIKEMVENGILEILHSPHVNPLMIVQRETRL
jgi:hypothetical protein